MGIQEADMASYQKDKNEILVRLRRMEGQIKGIQKMVEEDKYCIDVLNQLSSVIAATQNLAALILSDHIHGCVREALKQSDNGDAQIKELIATIERFTRK
jgi:DNA-binding FrmR family transcriptional regulator